MRDRVDFLGHALDDLRLPDGDAAIHAGVDMVELDQFGRILAMGGEEFLATVYTAREREHCDGRLERLATRFAAKEAATKALGTGLRDVGLLEIEVVSEANGRPHLEFHGRARDRAGELGITSMAVSLTDTQTAAVAFVVALAAPANTTEPSLPLRKESKL